MRLDLLTSKLEAECKANLRFTNNAEGAKFEFAAKKNVIAAAAKVLASFCTLLSDTRTIGSHFGFGALTALTYETAPAAVGSA